jgi:hypothetical protein
MAFMGGGVFFSSISYFLTRVAPHCDCCVNALMILKVALWIYLIYLIYRDKIR